VAREFCPRHMDETPVGRCEGCYKAFCESCRVEYEGRGFCSRLCLDRSRHYYADKPKTGSRPGLLSSLLGMAIPGALLCGGVYWLAFFKDIGWAKQICAFVGVNR